MALAQAKVDFHSDPLTFDLAQIFTKKCSKIAKSNPLQFLDSPMGKFFPRKLFCFKFGHLLQGEKGIKVGPKV